METYNLFVNQSDIMVLGIIIFAASCTSILSFTHRHGDSSYVSSAKLTSLAQSAALEAKQAAAYQQIAANHASFAVKNRLAQSAANAATTAQAALLEKKLTIQMLKKRLREAERDLEDELLQYEILQEIALAFNKTAEEYNNHVKALSALIENITITADKSPIEAVSGDVRFGSFKIIDDDAHKNLKEVKKLESENVKPVIEVAESIVEDVIFGSFKIPVVEKKQELKDISFGSFKAE